MKKNWEIKRLGDVCDYDKIPNKNSNLPYVGLEHIESNSGKFIGSTNPKSVKSLTFHFTNEHILYGRLRPYLNKVLSPSFEGQCSTEIFPIKPKTNLSRGFLFHWLLSNVTVKRINATCTGTRMPRANMNTVLGFEIPIPPLSEQQRIVAILDEAFAAIATAKENTGKNLQNARALFESHLQSVFTQRGEGWAEKRLGDVCDLIDCLHKTPTYIESGFPMVRVTDIKPGFLDLSNTRQVDEKTFNEFSKKHTPKVGDIVFSRVGSYGVSSLVTSDAPFCLGQNTVFIVPKINFRLLYYFLNSLIAKTQFDELIDGTTQPTISLRSIREVRFTVPPSHDHEKLIAYLDVVSLETHRLESLYQRKSAALDELKKSLLQKAFNGELSGE
ncbi:MAG: restriction endonuclease subunit S [Dehalococcoidia bacterium]|jgi:type I restriction enzyme S subunit